jgi:hypothetical protein
MLRAQKTARFGVGVEHHLPTGTRMALRLFQENSGDQLVKAFLKSEHAGGAGHFLVENHGDFRSRGFGVALSQAVGPMEGSVGYTFGLAKAIGLATPDSELLPFVGWNGTNWEVMVAVRNLFYDDIESASFLDELAVIDAPRRVLGGLTVRF